MEKFVPTALGRTDRPQTLMITIDWLEDFLLHPENGEAKPVLASCFGQLMECARHREPASVCASHSACAGSCATLVLLVTQLCYFARVAVAAVADLVDVQIAYRAIIGFVGPVLLLEPRAGTTTRCS